MIKLNFYCGCGKTHVARTAEVCRAIRKREAKLQEQLRLYREDLYWRFRSENLFAGLGDSLRPGQLAALATLASKEEKRLRGGWTEVRLPGMPADPEPEGA